MTNDISLILLWLYSWTKTYDDISEDLHDLLDELNDFKNALVKLSSVFTNQTDALNRKAHSYSSLRCNTILKIVHMDHIIWRTTIWRTTVALKRILGLYHAKECDEVDLDKQIANLGIDF